MVQYSYVLSMQHAKSGNCFHYPHPKNEKYAEVKNDTPPSPKSRCILSVLRQIIPPVEWKVVLQRQLPRSLIDNDIVLQFDSLLNRGLHPLPAPRNPALGDGEPQRVLQRRVRLMFLPGGWEGAHDAVIEAHPRETELGRRRGEESVNLPPERGHGGASDGCEHDCSTIGTRALFISIGGCSG